MSGVLIKEAEIFVVYGCGSCSKDGGGNGDLTAIGGVAYKSNGGVAVGSGARVCLCG